MIGHTRATPAATAIAVAAIAFASAMASAAPGGAVMGGTAPPPSVAANAMAPPPIAGPTAADDDEGPPRLSLPTASDSAAWRQPGFRLALGVVYGRLVGLGGAPSGRLLGPVIRMGLRLDQDWSVLVSLEYAEASAAGGLDGLRFAGTIDPTWHVTRHLSLAVGFGFGGIVEGSTSRPDPKPTVGLLHGSYTFPDARTPLPSCSGAGAAGLARAEWSWVLGPRSSTSLALEVVGQWTGCVDDTGIVDNETGQSIVRRQWWPHTGGTLAWGFEWR